MKGLGKLPQLCRGIIGGQQVTDDLDQALDLGVVNQAAHGVRGLAAFDAGGLLRMQQQAVVEQQTQARATHGTVLAGLLGQLDPAVMGFPVLEEHFD